MEESGKTNTRKYIITILNSLWKTHNVVETLSFVGSANTSVFLFYVQEILIPQPWVVAIVALQSTATVTADTV